jgi:NAD+ synthase (glutamine-hydrolysing)
MLQDSPKLRVALAQMDLLVGDIEGNAAKVLRAANDARDRLQADIIVFPELTLCGYPPEDLLLRPGFQDRVAKALVRLERELCGIYAAVGYPARAMGGLYNAAVLLGEKRRLGVYFKQHLPNYSVFDEKRYFQSGREPCVVNVKNVPIALTICEDLWHPGPMQQAHEAGARLMLNLNASPYHMRKGDEREAVLRMRVAEAAMPVVYVNLVGGQDELVFDGGSVVVDAQGQTVFRMVSFCEEMRVVDFTVGQAGVVPETHAVVSHLPDEASVYRAIVLGVRDYIEKNRFEGAVIGLSGGVDSALTLAIAVDAIGAQRVEAVMMPSRYTAAMSLEDARAEAEALGVHYRELSIEPAFESFLATLCEEFAGLPVDVTEENIQARCRGVLLMAISNKKRKIVLTTGNKSEMAVGYATLYGDMAGGFAPIKDVPKTLVYRLARYRNALAPVIPERVLERAPSAELAPDQKDEDSLPPYAVLDGILERYIEKDEEPDDIVAAGFDAATVQRVVQLVNRNEYKRRQAPPGVRVTRRAFGRDRRYPITRGA